MYIFNKTNERNDIIESGGQAAMDSLAEFALIAAVPKEIADVGDLGYLSLLGKEAKVGLYEEWARMALVTRPARPA